MRRICITLLFLFLLGFAVLNAQTNVYLKISDIIKESEHKNPKDEIEIKNFSRLSSSTESHTLSGQK